MDNYPRKCIARPWDQTPCRLQSTCRKHWCMGQYLLTNDTHNNSKWKILTKSNVRSLIHWCFFYHYLFDNVGVILQDPTAKFKCTVVGERSFPAAAPKKWNGLPDYIKKENDFDKFKRLIKTHYFKEAYSDLSLAIVGFYFLLLSSLFTSYLVWVMLNYPLGRKYNKWLSFRI